MRSGMFSSSTASNTRRLGAVASISRMRAARTSSVVAPRKESSSCSESCRRMTMNSPRPSSRMIVANVATYQIVRRMRSRTSRCSSPRDEVASIAKTISGAAHSLDQLVWKLIVDLSAQAPHQHLEHIGERIMVLVPDVCGDRSPVDHLSVVQNEKLQQ